jgi:dihydroxyacid dehydratase/phosphogluconate dehydratase
VTSALKHIPGGNRVALITDARFSGVSTGACIGHVGPEALAGGPIGKLVDGDVVRVVIDTGNASGSIDLVGHLTERFTPDEAAATLAGRPSRDDLAADPHLPGDTKLWALLQAASGGTWRGCIYDAERIAARLSRD